MKGLTYPVQTFGHQRILPQLYGFGKHPFLWSVTITAQLEYQAKRLLNEKVFLWQFRNVSAHQFWQLCKEWDFTRGSNWAVRQSEIQSVWNGKGWIYSTTSNEYNHFISWFGLLKRRSKKSLSSPTADMFLTVKADVGQLRQMWNGQSWRIAQDVWWIVLYFLFLCLWKWLFRCFTRRTQHGWLWVTKCQSSSGGLSAMVNRFLKHFCRNSRPSVRRAERSWRPIHPSMASILVIFAFSRISIVV